MPSFSFFRNLGLFAEKTFLDRPLCEQIREQVCLASSAKGLITGTESPEGLLDEGARRVLCANVDASTSILLTQRLMDLKPRLEKHFGVLLSSCEKPNFLAYEEGAFYKRHLDTGPTAPPDVARRRVSVVVFVNGSSREPEPDCFGGGSLTFYGLLDGPEWEQCAFSLDAEPGLLIAFRSHILHEVKAVTFGQRLTIVSWFTSAV